MERHDTTMRAARYLLGAGTIAIAMVATTTARVSAETTACIGEVPTVCGHVFSDQGTSDGDFQVGEGVSDITVVLTTLGGELVATATPNNPTMTSCSEGVSDPGCGYYSFDINEPGDYLVCIVLSGQSMDCSDTMEHPETQHVAGGTPGQTADFELPSDEPPPPPVWGSGTGTPGYWKNHSSAWPVDTIVIGDPALKTWSFTKEQAIALLSKPVAGDKTYTIFASLVSAMLNVYGDANNPVCIANEITDAHHWFSLYGGTVGVGSGVKAKSDAWVGGPTNPFKAAELIHTKMDDYNNGLLCAPHRN
ncbi:MAG TPA: hypothetical protein VGQ37_07720 [Vicinamibacterales bacterium]|jgi:hypothetical protein|nr:hypothetical protein [Vicinamibacterales bacterium]